jgi:hypothetical protein
MHGMWSNAMLYNPQKRILKRRVKEVGTLGHTLSASSIAPNDSILHFALQKLVKVQSCVHVLQHKCTQLNTLLATNIRQWESCDFNISG